VIIQCDKCGAHVDDDLRMKICPHETLARVEPTGSIDKQPAKIFMLHARILARQDANATEESILDRARELQAEEDGRQAQLEARYLYELRDKIAMAALTVILYQYELKGTDGPDYEYAADATASYKFADAMLEAKKKR